MEEKPRQELTQQEQNDKYLTEEEKAFGNVLDFIGQLTEQQRADGEPESLPFWYTDNLNIRRLPRRAPISFLKKYSHQILDVVIGRPVMHTIWDKHHNHYRNHKDAKFRRPLKLPIQEEDCILTPEDLAEVKLMLEEVKEFKRSGNKAPEWPAASK